MRTGNHSAGGGLIEFKVARAALTRTFYESGGFRKHVGISSPPRRKQFQNPARAPSQPPPNGFTAKLHHLDAQVGGTYRMSFTNFSTGKRHAFGGTYLELSAPERLRYTDQFDDPNLPGTMQTTISLKPVLVGTELDIVQAGVPAIIPVEACYLGWQESLILLGKLVEAEIPDEGGAG
jgi:uncharacterized protein YndB with AHSA1/START domain